MSLRKGSPAGLEAGIAGSADRQSGRRCSRHRLRVAGPWSAGPNTVSCTVAGRPHTSQVARVIVLSLVRCPAVLPGPGPVHGAEAGTGQSGPGRGPVGNGRDVFE